MANIRDWLSLSLSLFFTLSLICTNLRIILIGQRSKNAIVCTRICTVYILRIAPHCDIAHKLKPAIIEDDDDDDDGCRWSRCNNLHCSMRNNDVVGVTSHGHGHRTLGKPDGSLFSSAASDFTWSRFYESAQQR